MSLRDVAPRSPITERRRGVAPGRRSQISTNPSDVGVSLRDVAPRSRQTRATSGSRCVEVAPSWSDFTSSL
ncbi:hypothetical protein F2Q69_00048220 [Brassica cretica]|uniref:Uncharacterized protein n=1 Tax=Brassica cretica TaxID=69181 RepID=A0A8S9PK44_BRACR|nr:hypothetical protein F2Q69_00048220 [Brassica cretica]